LSSWWLSLEPSQRVEIIKIFIDKGLLALVVAVAGFLLARSLERYKTRQLRQIELEKAAIPHLYAILDQADRLRDEGRKVIAAMAQAYETDWIPWIDRLLANKSKPLDGLSVSDTAAKILNDRLESGSTLQQHLISFNKRLYEKLLKVQPCE
jgi:hypothetical protein